MLGLIVAACAGGLGKDVPHLDEEEKRKLVANTPPYQVKHGRRENQSWVPARL